MKHWKLLTKLVAAGLAGRAAYWLVESYSGASGEFIAPVAAMAVWIAVIITLFPNELILKGRSNILAVRAMLIIVLLLNACLYLVLALVQ